VFIPRLKKYWTPQYRSWEVARSLPFPCSQSFRLFHSHSMVSVFSCKGQCECMVLDCRRFSPKRLCGCQADWSPSLASCLQPRRPLQVCTFH